MAELRPRELSWALSHRRREPLLPARGLIGTPASLQEGFHPEMPSSAWPSYEGPFRCFYLLGIPGQQDVLPRGANAPRDPPLWCRPARSLPTNTAEGGRQTSQPPSLCERKGGGATGVGELITGLEVPSPPGPPSGATVSDLHSHGHSEAHVLPLASPSRQPALRGKDDGISTSLLRGAERLRCQGPAQSDQSSVTTPDLTQCTQRLQPGPHLHLPVPTSDHREQDRVAPSQ